MASLGTALPPTINTASDCDIRNELAKRFPGKPLSECTEAELQMELMRRGGYPSPGRRPRDYTLGLSPHSRVRCVNPSHHSETR